MSNYRSENKAISEWRNYNKDKKQNKTGKNFISGLKMYNALNKTYKGMNASAYGNEFAKFYSNPHNYAGMSNTMKAVYSPERLAQISANPGTTIATDSFGLKDLWSVAKNTFAPTEAFQSASQLGKTAKLLGEGQAMASGIPATTSVVATPTGATTAGGLASGATQTAGATTAGATTAGATTAGASAGTGAVAGASTASSAGATAGAGATGTASGGMMQAMMSNPITAILALALAGGIGAGKKGSTLQRWFNPNGGVK